MHVDCVMLKSAANELAISLSLLLILPFTLHAVFSLSLSLYLLLDRIFRPFICFYLVCPFLLNAHPLSFSLFLFVVCLLYNTLVILCARQRLFSQMCSNEKHRKTKTNQLIYLFGRFFFSSLLRFVPFFFIIVIVIIIF